jgi:outer membrane protein OmpA-like peptidoglycan-associated protein
MLKFAFIGVVVAAVLAAAAPAQDRPAAQCNQGPYIVFFEWNSAALTSQAGTILDSAATAYGSCGTASVMLTGHTDSAGAAEYNLALAQRRNAAVQRYLSRRGVPPARIAGGVFGESMPRVPTDDAAREPQNRRVEITYAPATSE